jgi:hypothetical protein
MQVSRLLAIVGLIAALVAGGAAHALTYDSHISRNADGSPGFQDPDQAQSSHFGVTGGGSGYDNGSGNSPFLGSSDHNFSAPDVNQPYGGLIPGQNYH